MGFVVGFRMRMPNWTIRVKRIAAGLAEPLGLVVVDDAIYVLQKQALTRLVDHDVVAVDTSLGPASIRFQEPASNICWTACIVAATRTPVSPPAFD